MQKEEFYKMRNAQYIIFGDSEIRGIATVVQEKEKPGSRILEIACGSGIETSYLMKRGFELVSFDINPDAFKYAKDIAKKSGVKPDFAISDAISLPVKNGSFNAVVCLHLLQTMKPKEREFAIAEISRVLETGGRAYLSTHSYRNAENEEKADILDDMENKRAFFASFSNYGLNSIEEYEKADIEPMERGFRIIYSGVLVKA